VLLNSPKISLESFEELENQVRNAKLLYLKYYLLDNKRAGLNLRTQLKGIEKHCEKMRKESLDTLDERKAINFTLTGAKKKLFKHKIERIMNDSNVQSD